MLSSISEWLQSIDKVKSEFTQKINFNVYGSVHRNNILIYIYIQQDAHVTEFILSDNCSTCFGFVCVVGGVSHPQHTQTGSNSSTIAADNNKV